MTGLACILAMWGTMALAAAALAAPGAPVGTEFQVNSYTTGNQRSPAVAADASGGFVVTWHSDQDGDAPGIFGQRFGSDGVPRGAEFQINTYTSGSQNFPVVASDADGDFVVVWQSAGQDLSSGGLFAQLYDRDGVAVGTEFQVNSTTTNSQSAAAVAADEDGDFVAVWASPDASGLGIFGQRFDSSGGFLGSEFQVNTYTPSFQTFPSVSTDADGDFVVVWQSLHDGGTFGVFGIFGQRYDSAGAPLGTEFQVNTYTTYSQVLASVAADADGDFTVAWHSAVQDGDGSGTFGQRFSSSGALLGTEFQINSYTTDLQYSPRVAADADGNTVVIWRSDGQDGSSIGIFGQRFASDGAPVGAEFQVNTYTYDQQNVASVAMNAAGQFVVAWQGGWSTSFQDGDLTGIFAQRFAAAPSSTATATATLTPTATPTPTSTSLTNPGCPATPVGGCVVSAGGKLVVRDGSDDSADRLVWKFAKGPALAQADFGDPTVTNAFAFCVYDDGARKIDLTIPAGAFWEAAGARGYRYKDADGTNDGVTVVKLYGGEAGRSKLQLKGKGAGLALPAAEGPAQLFAAASAVRVQLHGNGACYETTFTAAQSRHRAGSYSGRY